MPGAEHSVVMKATPKEIFDVVTDYESYPDFLPMMKSAEIKNREGEHIVTCEFRISMLKEFTYILRLVHKPYEQTRWTYVEGSFKDNTGGWDFVPVSAAETKVNYQVDIDFGFLVPKLIARNLVGSSLPSMLQSVEKRVYELRKK